ncbi:MAG: ATP-dependent DNA helicase RecG [Clostridia bacterium]|nr:ATP-dependent DNA helicase RecG [Clostridia bacterium]
MLGLNTEIRQLYGVGAAREKAYARLGIHTVGDLLAHYPRGYENRGDVSLLSESDGVSKSSHVLTVATEPKSARIRGRMSLLKFRAFDESGVCEITFFNQDYLKQIFCVGSSFRFYGRVERKVMKTKTAFSMTSPAYEPWREEIPLRPLVSVYPLTEGLTQKQITKDIQTALSALDPSNGETDPLDEETRLRNRLCLRSYALRNIHSPDSFVALAAAKRRLIFDEFLLFSLRLSLSGGRDRRPWAPPCTEGDVSELEAVLPYRLTGAQKRVIGEIAADMAKDRAMSRMVVGDVGCGKTVCAAAAILLAVRSGKQSALMAPTEILARQHAAELTDLLGRLGIRCACLTGDCTAAQKRKIYEALAQPDPDKRLPVVIGTQALLSKGVTFADAGLVITDEQHRFGVNQRAALSDKSRFAHTLVMSATPIPRSLALSLYGDLDVSRIDEMPPGRQRVDTFAVDESYRERLCAFIRKQVEGGGRVYAVCPSIEESEAESADLELSDIDGQGNLLEDVRTRRSRLHSAIQYAEELGKKLDGIEVGCLHGRMKSAQKDAVMERFAKGELSVLVSTTVIEVGVNVPEATLMIVENAERFGLSQLHQLRGRVGRGRAKSYCILVSESAGGEGKAAERLETMRRCYDGYEIAERDLVMRGPGDFLRGSREESVRQSGGVRFRLAELCDDTGLLQAAVETAQRLLAVSSDLSAYPVLRGELADSMTPAHNTIN